MKFAYQEEVLVDVLEDVQDIETKSLVVYNDDYNTFEHVINTLIKVCKHSTEQAEQCTYIIHFKGKCSVKDGTVETLAPMKRAINEAGIEARIH